MSFIFKELVQVEQDQEPLVVVKNADDAVLNAVHVRDIGRRLDLRNLR